MKRRDLRLCSCVCAQWRDLIYQSRVLTDRKDSIDPFEKIHKVYDFEGPCGGLCEICVFSGRIITSGWASNRVMVFDKQGRLVNTFGSEFYGPYGLCSSLESLFVADNHNKRIQVFDANYHHTRSIHTFGYRPRDICCTDKGHIAISTNEDMILILDQQGNLLRKVELLEMHKNKLISNAGICVNSRGEILVGQSKEQIRT